MTARGFWATAALAAALIAGVAPAPAQVDERAPDPAVWLRQVYDLYRRAEGTPALEDQADFHLIAKRASKSLAALFKRDDDCVRKSHLVCALDWDFVVDGQASRLTNIKVGPAVVAGDKATVTASFRNMRTPCVNVYHFVREAGEWRVDDIETKSGAAAPLRIAKLLRDFDYTQ
jgi:hypothetical protein